MFHSRTFRSIVILIVALAFASTAYALAASNTFTDSGKAGDGNSGITGFTISAVSYNLSASNPIYVASVDLTFDTAPSEVAAMIDGTNATSCTGPGVNWNCVFPANTVTAASAANLTVIAAE
jgi:hypothetical protein